MSRGFLDEDMASDAVRDSQDARNVELVATIVRETDKALLIDGGDREPYWLPRSLVIEAASLPDRGAICLTVPAWWATNKGLI